MASKYIQPRESVLELNQSDAERLASFINQFGESLIKIIENCSTSIQDIPTAKDSEDFRKYQLSLENLGFNNSEITQIEHTLFAKGIFGENLFIESNYQIEKIVDEYLSINEGVVDFLVGLWNALTEDGSPIGILHLILDIIGFIPGSWVGFPIDVVADGLNALIYMFRGRWLDAAISGVAAFLPGVGDLAKTVKYGKNAAKLEKAVESIVKTGKAEEKLIAELADDSGAKMVLDGMTSFGSGLAKTFRAIITGIGTLLSTPPINWLTFGLSTKLGKWLIKWVDEAVTPIARNLEKFGTRSLSGADDVAGVIKSGDITKIADNIDELVAAGKFADVAQQVPFRRMLEKAKIDFTDEMLADPDLFRKALDGPYNKYIDELEAFRKSIGKPLERAELAMLDGEMRAVYYEMKTNEALAKGLLALDKAEPALIARVWAAAIPSARGASLSGDIFKVLKNDPEKIKKFFGWLVNNPQAVKALNDAGPGVTQLFRVFARNPEIAIKVSAAGSDAAAKFAKLESELGDLGVALYRRRFNRNRLIIAKYLIGAPLRCPVKFINRGTSVIFQTATNLLGPDEPSKKGFGQFTEGLKYIKNRQAFLAESTTLFQAIEEKEETDEFTGASLVIQNTDVKVQLEEMKKDVEKQTAEVSKKQGMAIFGPKSYNDICLSAEADFIDNAAASLTASDSSGHPEENRPQIQEITGAKPLPATENDAAVNATLRQVGVPEISNSAEGTLIDLDNTSPVDDIARARLDADLSERGLWYHLAKIQNGELVYEGSVATKVNTLVELYSTFYAKTADNAARLGKPTLYPNPIETGHIKSELKKLQQDQSYQPKFFGTDVSASIVY